MANDTESVDSNGNSNDLRPRRSSRAKGKQANNQVDESDDHVIVNNIAYKIGDFVYYFDKKQDVFRIGLIEEFKFQKRDKLSNKKAEITLKQFFRLDEVPATVLSNQGEYDTHVMPQNFPDWLRQREIFITDNTLSTGASTLRGLCTVRHFPDLNHAMVLFSSAQTNSNNNNANSPNKLDHHSLLIGKDPSSSLPVVPRHRDDNTFFYVFSYNPRGRKLAATYLEIRVGGAYQAELPELRSTSEQVNDPNMSRDLEQMMWKPEQIPEEVYSVYQMATFSLSCFSGFGGGVDDNASVENGSKIASHMLTQQRALDCLHRSHYNMEKAIDFFAERALPEPNKIPFLWTDEDHTLFDESVKVHGKNFLRIQQDKRNKKSRRVGDFVTFYYFWKKNRPKNRKYTAKKMLRSRISLQSSNNNNNNDNSNAAQDAGSKNIDSSKQEPTVNDKLDGINLSPSDVLVEHCFNCSCALPKLEKEVDEKPLPIPLSDRLRNLCDKCQSYFRRYGYQRPTDLLDKRIKSSDGSNLSLINGGSSTNPNLTMDNNNLTNITDDNNDIDDDDEDDEDGDAEDDYDDDDEVQKHAIKSNPLSPTPTPLLSVKEEKQVNNSSSSSSKNNNIAAINKYDFDQEDENVEEVSSLLKRSQAKHSLVRESDIKPFKSGTGMFSGSNKSVPSTPTSKQQLPPQSSQFHKLADSNKTGSGVSTNTTTDSNSSSHLKSNKRSSSFSKRSHTNTPNSVGDLSSSTSQSGGGSKRRRTHNNNSSSTSDSKQQSIPASKLVVVHPPQLPINNSNRSTPTLQQQHSHNKKPHNPSSITSNQRRVHHHITSKSSSGAGAAAGSSNQKQRHLDSNSSASSSSSSSNDSSSSSDDIEDVPLAKRTTATTGAVASGAISAVSAAVSNTTNLQPSSNISSTTTTVSNIPSIAAGTSVNNVATGGGGSGAPQAQAANANTSKPDLKIQRLDLPSEATEPTYNQMITSTPNIPGVCAVTEPELLSQPNRKSQPPVPPQSIPNPQLSGSNNPTALPLPDVKNFDGISSQQHPAMKLSDTQGNEDMILNLVKKRAPIGNESQHSISSPVPHQGTTIDAPSSASAASVLPASVTNPNQDAPVVMSATPGNSHNYWTQRHEGPSKLVHHRGDYAMGPDGNMSLQEIIPKKMVNGLELLHRSKFGLLLRAPKSPGDESSCSRVDLHHNRAELTELEREERQRFFAEARKKQQALDTHPQQTYPHQHSHQHNVGPLPQQQSVSSCQSSKQLSHTNMLPPIKHQQQQQPSLPIQQQQSKKIPPSLRSLSPPQHPSLNTNNNRNANTTPMSAGVATTSITPPNLGAVRQQAVRPPTVPPQPPQSVPPPHSSGVNPLLMDFMNASKMPNDFMLYQNFGQVPMSNEDLMKQEKMKMLSLMSSSLQQQQQQQQHQHQQHQSQQQQMALLNRQLLGAMTGTNQSANANNGGGAGGDPSANSNLASLGHNSAIADLLLQTAYQQQQQQQQLTEQHLANILRHCYPSVNSSSVNNNSQPPPPPLSGTQQPPNSSASAGNNRPRSAAAGSLDKQQQQQSLQDSDMCNVLRALMGLAPDQQQHLQSMGLQQGWMNPGGASASGGGVGSSGVPVSSSHHPAHVSSNSHPPHQQHHPHSHPHHHHHHHPHQKPNSNTNNNTNINNNSNNNPAAAQSFQNLGLPGNSAPNNAASAALLLQHWQQYSALQQIQQQQQQQQPPSQQGNSNSSSNSGGNNLQQARHMQPHHQPSGISNSQLELYQMMFNTRR